MLRISEYLGLLGIQFYKEDGTLRDRIEVMKEYNNLDTSIQRVDISEEEWEAIYA